MREFETLDNDIGGGAYKVEPCGTGDLDTADGLGLDKNGLIGGALPADGNVCAGGIDPIGQGDDSSGAGPVDGVLQTGQGIDGGLGGGNDGVADEEQRKKYKILHGGILPVK